MNAKTRGGGTFDEKQSIKWPISPQIVLYIIREKKYVIYIVYNYTLEKLDKTLNR